MASPNQQQQSFSNLLNQAHETVDIQGDEVLEQKQEQIQD
jgi:hypothetical protein